MMKRVAIFPPWEPWMGNRMFDAAEGCVYSAAFGRWRAAAAESGYQLETCDRCPASEADIVWFMDLPREKRVFEAARSSARDGTPFVLQILESPLLFPAAFVEANRRKFDAVVSFEFKRDEKRNFAYRLPVESEPQYQGLPFGRRKLAVMVNTNRVEGWLATRKLGWTGLPGIGGCFSGWKMPSWHFVQPAHRELYSWRRKCARAAEKTDGRLEVFGSGWSGGKISWCPGVHTRSYRNHRPAPPMRDGAAANAEKRSMLGEYRFVIASENYRGNRGYVSEKIFDAMLGGSVPVYLGEEKITSEVPAEAFVDAREFHNMETLWRHLESMPEAQWALMRKAGQDYLASEAFKSFTGESFAHRMMEILTKVADSPADANRCKM